MTPDHGRPSKCLTCTHASVIKGYAESEQIIRCAILRKQVPFPVYDCSDYELRQTMSLNQLWNMAYLIKANKSGVIGFTTPRRLREDYNDEYDY